MFIYILPISIFIGLYKYEEIKTYYNLKIDEYNQIKNMVEINNTNPVLIHYNTIKIISQYIYDNILKYLDNRTIKKTSSVYEINFYIENKKFRMPIKIKRGPSRILSAIAIDDNDNSIDITRILKEYISPYTGKLDNKLLTSEYLGYKKVIINDEIKFFEKDNILF